MNDLAQLRPLSAQQRITLVSAAVAVAVMMLPTLAWLWGYWVANIDHFIGVLAPAISLGLVWMKRRNLIILGTWSDARGWALFVPGLLLQLASIALDAPLLSALALPLMLHGLVWAIVGPLRASLLAFPIWFLLFAFPFMDRLEIYLSFPMRLASTVIAEGLLSPFIEVQRLGASLFTANLEVAVIPSCSGMNYLSTLLMLGVLLAWLSEARRLAQFIALLMTLPVVLLANGIRVASIGVLGHLYGRETALGFFHDFSGLLVFGLAMLGMILVNALLMRYLPDPVGATTQARPRSGGDLD